MARAPLLKELVLAGKYAGLVEVKCAGQVRRVDVRDAWTLDMENARLEVKVESEETEVFRRVSLTASQE